MDEKPHDAVDLRALDELIAQVRDGAADPDAVARLEGWVVRDSAACWHYVQSMNLDAGLAWHYAGPPDEFHEEPRVRPSSSGAAVPLNVVRSDPTTDAADTSARRTSPRLKLIWPMNPASLAAGLTSLALILAVCALVYRSVVGPPGGDPRAGIEVAQLQSDQDCVWSGDRDHVNVGDSLRSGERLELKEGIAKLLFQTGTTVVVESPAVIELATATSMRVDRGTVAVRVNGPKKEFVVVSPEASIVDLGTSFGVHADEDGTTDVEVFEGAVEVHSKTGSDDGQVLGLGASARVSREGRKTRVDFVASQQDRFGDLLEVLWADMSRGAETGAAADGNEAVVVADFKDAPIPNTIDTFYGAVPGRGWLTPWLASGNPIGEVRKDQPLSGAADPYLHVHFVRGYERCVARAYGPRRGFDPARPHVITWRWRLDGTLEQLQDHFQDRVYFYGNPFFRRNSWPTNSWLVGVVGADETASDTRTVFARHWYAFNGGEGEDAKVFDRRNMVDTGMKLKQGVVYRFAVAVYPEQARYDVAIRDDERTFVRTGLKYRNQQAAPANVLHFGVGSDKAGADVSFSLDAVSIRPLEDGPLQREVEDQGESPQAD